MGEIEYKEYQITCEHTENTVFIKRDPQFGVVNEIDCEGFHENFSCELIDKKCIQIKRKYQKISDKSSTRFSF